MDEPQRERLLAEWLDGGRRDKAPPELLEALNRDPDFRRSAAKALVVARLLEQRQFADEAFASEVMEGLKAERDAALTSDVVTRLQGRQSRQRLVSRLSVGLAAAAAIALGLFLALGPRPSEPTVRVVAVEGVGSLKAERLLEKKTIRMRRGLLELELDGRARVVIEAPAAFSVLGKDRIYLKRGRCYAEMEKGDSGLVIETPSGEVLDLGTRFAVDVNDQEDMEVHVFDGEVKVTKQDHQTHIEEGQAYVFRNTGPSETFASVPMNFVSEIPGGSHRGAPYLHWTFDEGSGLQAGADGTGADLALATARFQSSESTGAVPDWIEGVFGSALAFSGSGEWLDTRSPGISGDRDRTFAGWVRIPANWAEESNEAAPISSWGLILGKEGTGKGWMLAIGRKSRKNPQYFGRLRLSLGQQHIIGSTDLKDGQWHHIAAVVSNGPNGPTALLYVDGEIENTTRNTIESMETETENEASETIRFGRQIYYENLFLRGALDELYLFESALSGDQIRALMQGETPESFNE